MKRWIASVLLVVGVGLAGNLPSDPRFDTPVTLNLATTQQGQNQVTLSRPLDVILEALAKSVGLQILIYREFDAAGAAQTPRIPNVRLDFQGRTFREVWDLLFNTYGLQLGLDYRLVSNNVIVVAPTELISALAEADQRGGTSSRVLYLVSIPIVAYINAQGQPDYERAKTWVQNNFIPFANREFGSLAINWLVVQEGSGTTIVLQALASILGTEPQHRRFQETLARARYGYELLPEVPITAAGQVAPPATLERTFTLTNVSFEDLRNFLTAQLPKVTLSVIPTNPRVALARGTEAELSRLAELLKTADQPKVTTVSTPTKQVYTLQSRNFTEASADLNQLLNQQLPGARVEAVPFNPKAFILTATPEQQTLFGNLLRAIDVAAPVAAPSTKQVYSLQNRTFDQVSGDLKALVDRELPGVRVESVPGNPRALVVEGNADQQATFAKLLQAVDIVVATAPSQSGQPELVRKVYPVRNADSATLANFLSRDIPGISVTIVEKQLVIRASEAQHQEITNLLSTLDVAPPSGPARVQKLYQLSNAQAGTLAPILTQALQTANLILPQSSNSGSTSTTSTSAASTPTTSAGAANLTTAVAQQLANQQSADQFLASIAANAPSIVPDERTNILIITATAEQLAVFDRLIPELDRPVQLVNVQVRIQEVSSNVTNRLGIRWDSLSGGNLITSILDGALNLIFDSTRSLASLNIRATLDALQEQGLSRTLNDTNITVLNNQAGRIQSGQTLFLRRVVGGNVEQVPFEIGVIVSVTPQITADGGISMLISTDVSGSNIQFNPVDGLPRQFDRQSSSTTLRIKDGQTIVLGGLIQQSSNTTTNRVPLLGEIPILGELFTQRSNSNTDRELLVVITANIVKEVNQAAAPK